MHPVTLSVTFRSRTRSVLGDIPTLERGNDRSKDRRLRQLLQSPAGASSLATGPRQMLHTDNPNATTGPRSAKPSTRYTLPPRISLAWCLACEELDASQLAELASQAKHHAKEILGGSVYLVDGLAERESVVALGLSV